MTTSKGANQDNASFFVGTILGEEITEIDLQPQEYTYHITPKKKVKTKKVPETLALIRLDFVATIRTKSGEYKKVLIEIQKSQKPSILPRFCTYLGEQYKQENKKEDNKTKRPIPIVVLYMLGFTLPTIDAIAVKVNRTYVDIIGGGEITNKSPFIECLTHDGYFIQVPRINRETYADWEKCSELKKMLSLFEQNHFVNEKDKKRDIKKYPYPTTNKNIKKMIEALEYAVADPKIRRAMEEEYYARLNVLHWKQTIEEQSNALAQQAKELEEYRRRYGLLNGLQN
jgi:hypothetical protein